jgi:hypothetical protein
LNNDFTITVKTSGTCGQLHLEVVPSGTITQSVNLTPIGGATITGALSKNFTWSTGSKQVVVKDASNTVISPALNTLSVTVTN